MECGLNTIEFAHALDLIENHELNEKHIKDWKENEVGVWLTGIGFGEYVEAFKKQRVKGFNLLKMKEEEL